MWAQGIPNSEGKEEKRKSLPPLCSLEGMYSSADNGPVGSVVVSNRQGARERERRVSADVEPAEAEGAKRDVVAGIQG